MKSKYKTVKAKLDNSGAYNLYTLFEIIWTHSRSKEKLSEETKRKFNDFIDSLYKDVGFPYMIEITDNEVYLIGYKKERKEF